MFYVLTLFNLYPAFTFVFTVLIYIQFYTFILF